MEKCIVCNENETNGRWQTSSGMIHCCVDCETTIRKGTNNFIKELEEIYMHEKNKLEKMFNLYAQISYVRGLLTHTQTDSDFEKMFTAEEQMQIKTALTLLGDFDDSVRSRGEGIEYDPERIEVMKKEAVRQMDDCLKTFLILN